MTFRLRPLFLLSIIMLLAFGVACGGDDDDTGGTSPGFGPGSGGSGSSGRDSTAASSSGGNSARIAKIEDAAYTSGTVHIEVTGDKRATFDKDGSGYAGGGLLLMTFADGDVSALLTFADEGSGDSPGAAAVTTKEFSTAAEWGKDCTFKLEQSKSSASGEFECKDIQAIDLQSAKTYKVTVKGKFSAKE